MNRGKPKIKLKKGKGVYLTTKDNRKILDASSGASVSCIGYGNKKVNKAISNELKKGLNYTCSTFFKSELADKLSKHLIKSTNGKMSEAYLINSGSEATETAIKLARTYYYAQDKNNKRINIISR